MAEFCAQCTVSVMGGEANQNDFYIVEDKRQEYEDPNNAKFPALCEGCGYTIVDINGKCQHEHPGVPDEDHPLFDPMAVSHPMRINDLIEEVYLINNEKGWFDEPRDFNGDIALIHGEVSEAHEAYRDWGLDPSMLLHIDQDTGKPEGIASEYADVLIRIFDSCRRRGIDLETALRVKLDYNRTRPYRHGGKIV